MAICEAHGFSVDCGEGHGCAVVCTSDGASCWGMCGSVLSVFTTSKTGKLPGKMPMSEKLQFNCNNIRATDLAKGLSKLTKTEVRAKRGSSLIRLKCKTFVGTFHEIVSEMGLEIASKPAKKAAR